MTNKQHVVMPFLVPIDRIHGHFLCNTPCPWGGGDGAGKNYDMLKKIEKLLTYFWVITQTFVYSNPNTLERETELQGQENGDLRVAMTPRRVKRRSYR